jgi:hypothetical protein
LGAAPADRSRGPAVPGRLAILSLLTRLFGLAAKRLGQPPVLGEIIVGILLGTALLHVKIRAALFPITLRPPMLCAGCQEGTLVRR